MNSLPFSRRLAALSLAIVSAGALPAALLWGCSLDDSSSNESVAQAESALATLEDSGVVLPPGYDASVPFESCGIVAPPGIPIVPVSGLTCGHAALDVAIDGTCSPRIELNPQYCLGNNICCVLQHELLHVQHFLEACNLCKSLPVNQRADCVRCTKNAMECLSEAAAQGQGDAWCKAHDPNGDSEFTPVPGSGWGVPMPSPHDMQCGGLGIACQCIKQNESTGGRLPQGNDCAGRDLSGQMTFPPLHEMCACGKICTSVSGAGGCGNGFCPNNQVCATCTDCMYQPGVCQCTTPPLCTGCPSCGDGKCQGGEACDNCPIDCGFCNVCGNQTCDPLETPQNCPKDCQVGGNDGGVHLEEVY